MSGHQHAILEDTVYFWFASNDTSGSGGDGATPLYDVRKAGAAASAIPLLSGTPTLLTHANYPAGCYEISIAATAANGFADNDVFAVYCTLAIDSQNPTGFVGSCSLRPVPANIEEYLGSDVTGTLLTSEDIGLVHESSIGTVTGQAEYILDVAFSNSLLWTGNLVSIHDVSTDEIFSTWVVSAVHGTETVIVAADPPFTVVAGDIVRIKDIQHPRYAINAFDPPTASSLTSFIADVRGYFRLLFRNDAAVETDQATQLTDINADDGAGAGSYSAITDSLEANDAQTGAIKTATDKLTFTVTNQVDANMQSVDDILLKEAGTGSQGFGAS